MKRRVHNYTNETELCSLLIRIKNSRKAIGTSKKNNRINELISLHKKLSAITYDNQDLNAKRSRLKQKVREAIIKHSEETQIDVKSYETFGKIILLMIKNILTKPQFSGYSYKDDFYSDATFKILKYLDNFDHTLISERSGKGVNSFAYISQIILNSILYIINTRKKEQDELKKQVEFGLIQNPKSHISLVLDDFEIENQKQKELTDKTIYINSTDDLIQSIENILSSDLNNVNNLTIIYPFDYNINIDEYAKIEEIKKAHKGLKIQRC